MSHVYSFFLFAALFATTLRMLEAPSPKRLFLLMVIATMIVLVRPANVIALLVPMLYGATGPRDVKGRLRWPAHFPKAFAAGAVVSGALVLPQLAYWKMITGSWFVFTYGKKGEDFFWSHPHLWDVLWHCLLYTSDAADERSSVDLGGRRIIKKKNNGDIKMRATIKTKGGDTTKQRVKIVRKESDKNKR